FRRALGLNGLSSVVRKRRDSSDDSVTVNAAAIAVSASRNTASRTKAETGTPRKAAARVIRALSAAFRRKSSRAGVVIAISFVRKSTVQLLWSQINTGSIPNRA